MKEKEFIEEVLSDEVVDEILIQFDTVVDDTVFSEGCDAIPTIIPQLQSLDHVHDVQIGDDNYTLIVTLEDGEQFFYVTASMFLDPAIAALRPADSKRDLGTPNESLSESKYTYNAKVLAGGYKSFNSGVLFIPAEKAGFGEYRSVTYTFESVCKDYEKLLGTLCNEVNIYKGTDATLARLIKILQSPPDVFLINTDGLVGLGLYTMTQPGFEKKSNVVPIAQSTAIRTLGG